MILLDTSVFIGLAHDRQLAEPARAAILAAAARSALHVSAVTAWELGLLATRTGMTAALIGDARRFFEMVVMRSRLEVVALDARSALEAAYLPGSFHRDPSGRMIVAIARLNTLTLVTDDHAILDYAASGHVRAIAA